MSGTPARGLAGRLRALTAALRWPQDRETEAGRAQARHSAIALTALASAFARGIAILTSLAAVPLTLHFLGAERYGMWMTLSAFAALLALADLGIGNSALTAVAHGAGRGDRAELKRQISSAYGAMAGIAMVMLAVLAAAYPLIAWERVYNVSDRQAVAEAGPATAVFLAVVALSVPAGLVLRIQLGLQQGVRANLWLGAASLAGLAALLLAIRLEVSLPWLVLALAGTPVLVNLANTAIYFARVHPELRPRRAAFDLAAIRRLSGDGVLFLVLQLCAAVLFQINAPIIAQLLGPQQVANYAVPERMFAVIATVLSLFFMPLWAAYGDAAARGDIAWARRTLRRSLLLGVGGAAVLAAVLVAAGPWLLHWWVGDAVSVSFALLAGLGLWRVIEAAGNAAAMFLNGVNRLRVQVGAALATVLVSLPLRLWWGESFGLPGVIWATIASYALIALPVMALAVRRALAAMEREQAAAQT